MFDKNSKVVKAWVKLIWNGDRTLDDVPKLFNLREVVTEIIQEEEK